MTRPTLSATTLAVRILVAVVPSASPLIASHFILGAGDAIMISQKRPLFWQHFVDNYAGYTRRSR